jgi:hypothetical protein
VLSAAALVLGALGTGVASGARGAIACPLSAPGAVSCCPVPVAGSTTPCCPLAEAPAVLSCCGAAPGPAAVPFCCPPNALCAVPAITISSSPDPSSAGRPVTISGVVDGGAGVGATLWEKPAGGPGFHRVAATSTGSGGAYSFTPRDVSTNRSWYVSSGSLRSFTIAQEVRARVTLTAPASASAGTPLRLSGTVTPGHAGQSVLLLARRRGVLATVAHARLNRVSRYSLSHVFADRGGVTLVAELPADARNAASFSRPVTVAVSAP